MKTIDDIRHANLLLLLEELARRLPPDRRRGVVAALADLVNRSPSQISQLKTRARHSKTGQPRQIGPALARALEAAMDMPANWMDQTHDAQPERTAASIRKIDDGSLKGEEAYIAKQSEMTDPPLLEWKMMSLLETIPRRFSVAMPDDSMAPRLRLHQVARFDRDLDARPGDAVLVKDDQGRLYVRVYRERRPGMWEAHCVNEAYQSMDSERDGLQLVAVLTGSDGRWS